MTDSPDEAFEPTYSYLSASIGSKNAAFRAGYYPKNTPTSAENTNEQVSFAPRGAWTIVPVSSPMSGDLDGDDFTSHEVLWHAPWTLGHVWLHPKRGRMAGRRPAMGKQNDLFGAAKPAFLPMQTLHSTVVRLSLIVSALPRISRSVAE
jgi:hypothetical protein